MKINLKHFTSDSLDYQNIEVLAYHLYACQGFQQGRSLDHWIEAEKQLSENLFRL